MKIHEYQAKAILARHGVPVPRRLATGDIVKLDVTVEKDGYVADAAPAQTWDDATWPTMKPVLKDALRMQTQMRRRASWS